MEPGQSARWIPDAVDEQWASAAFVSLASLLDDSYLRKA